MKEIYVQIKGCDDSTEFNLKCTEDQLKFLVEFAKMTKQVSEYSCMPVINLYDLDGDSDEAESLVEEDAPLVAIMFNDSHEVENGDIEGGYVLDTTNLQTYKGVSI